MPDAQARDIVERLEGLSPSIMAMRAAQEIRHLRFQVRGQADEIDRLTEELEEAREKLVALELTCRVKFGPPPEAPIASTALFKKEMGEPYTPIGRGDGYYVHIDENGDAISVAANGVGPQGGWVGLSIARMALPDKNKTRQQINDAARLFSAAPEMFAALQGCRDIVARFYPRCSELMAIDAALSKATGEQA